MFIAYHYEPLVINTADGLALRWSSEVYHRDSKPLKSGFRTQLVSADFWTGMAKKGSDVEGSGAKKCFLQGMVNAIKGYNDSIPT